MQSGQTQAGHRDAVKPVTLTLNHRQLAWLDAKRQRGGISRSAALRQILDDLIGMTAAAPQQRRDD